MKEKKLEEMGWEMQGKKSEKYCGCVAEGVGGSSGQWAGAVGCLDTAVSSFLFFEKWPFARVLVL